MRRVSGKTEQIWMSGDYTGSQRPMVRATLQHPTMYLSTYKMPQLVQSSFTTKIYDDQAKWQRTPPGVNASDLNNRGPVSGSNIIRLLGTQVTSQTTVTGYTDTASAPSGTRVRSLLASSDNGTITWQGKTYQQNSQGEMVDASGKVIGKLPVGDGAQRTIQPYYPPPPKFVTNTYANYFFRAKHIPMELPNVKSVEWQRDVDTDVATATITMWNTTPLPLGETPLPGQLDEPGYFTYNRGTASFSGSRWKHTRNEWYAQLMPDNIVRTYEGYGFDPRVAPEKDPNLYASGVWIIDDVTMDAEGTLQAKCRDVGRILLDQLLTGPIVPEDFEPPSFTAADPLYETVEHYAGGGQVVKNEGTRSVPTTTGTSGVRRLNKKVLRSSVSFWDNENGYKGRYPSYASDDNQATYWISVGNGSPRAPFAYEWVEWDLQGQDIDHIALGTIMKGYQAYISVMIDGKWQGNTTVNYHEAGIGRNGSNIPYIMTQPVVSENVVIGFPKQTRVQKIRVTLGNLQYFANFGDLHYRAAIREVDFRCNFDETRTTYTQEKYTFDTVSKPVLVSSEKRLLPQPAGQNPGKYEDYTDIVVLLLAWAGFFYSTDSSLVASDGSRRYLGTPSNHPVLGNGVNGSVWGDFQKTGTTGKVALGSDGFHMKPIMDGIQVVKNILLFNFYFDEDGAAQWRQANLMEIGNWLREPYSSITAGDRLIINREAPTRTRRIYQIDESQVIKTLNATITNKNVREGILTYNPQKKAGYVTPGYNPNPTGLRRLAGWPNTGYDSAEALKMTGELIAQRQLQAYRNDEIVIPAFPALQIDDQIRLVERVTNEGWLHYIKGISSKIDISDGSYDYTLSTQWLGDEPSSQWWMNYNIPAYTKVARGKRTLHVGNPKAFSTVEQGGEYSEDLPPQTAYDQLRSNIPNEQSPVSNVIPVEFIYYPKLPYRTED